MLLLLETVLFHSFAGDSTYCNMWNTLQSSCVTYPLRKYSIFQAVATYDLRFLDIFVGWPGRSHDAKVYRNNPLYRTLPARLRRPPGRLVKSYHQVGDSAYPLTPQLMTPYRNLPNAPLNRAQKKFNQHLSSKRNVTMAIHLVYSVHQLVKNLIIWWHYVIYFNFTQFQTHLSL